VYLLPKVVTQSYLCVLCFTRISLNFT